MEKVGEGTNRKEPIACRDTGDFAKSDFIMPPHYSDYIASILIPHGLVLDRTEKLASDIHEAYKHEELHLVCILKGSRGFFNQILQFLTKIHTYSSTSSKLPPYMEHYVRVKSYQNDQSTGSINVISEDLSVLRGKHVLIVEDIIDTGLTLSKFCAWLQMKHEPKTVRVASLLEKRTERSNGFKGNFVGFSVPDEFLVGFSLDYNEFFRDMEHICILNEAGRATYKVPARRVSNAAAAENGKEDEAHQNG